MGLWGWLDDRSGIVGYLRDGLREPIPCAGRWRRAVGAAVVFLFALQVLTGVLLMAVYSPSATTAWSSVWYVQTQVAAGWLVRGVHRLATDALIILLGVYVLQILFAAAYRRPRELHWWIVLALLGLVAATAHTGYLLPWDEQAYWATKVRTNVLAFTPLVGESLRTLLLGGHAIGHASLTRFYTLHVVVLPACVVLLAGLNRVVARRARTTETDDRAHTQAEPFWPDQLFRSTAACAIVAAAILTTVWYGHAMSEADGLGPPADPASADYPARPEWYALFLFQWLKAFDGPTSEVIGAIVAPGLALALAALVPFYDRLLPERLAHRAAAALAVIGLTAVAALTVAARQEDRDPPEQVVRALRDKQTRGLPLDEGERRALRAWQFNRQRERAAADARRAFELAEAKGIPPEGPLALLADDPWTRGPRLFASHCASCHRFDGHDGLGQAPAEPAASSDLAGFASRAWVRGLLAEPMSPRYFGGMVRPEGEPAHTRMDQWTSEMREDCDTPEALAELHAAFDAAAAYLEDESLRPGRLAAVTADSAGVDPAGSPGDDAGESLIRRGRNYFMTECNQCHSYDGERQGTFHAPEMSGYGSVAWIERMIADPSHESLYRKQGRGRALMPSFEARLSPRERHLLAVWIHGSRGLHLDGR